LCGITISVLVAALVCVLFVIVLSLSFT
jgi:hypothetical protein